MPPEEKRRLAFPLRLALSLRESATFFANREGISLNQFISLAVAEKVSRLEQELISPPNARNKLAKLSVNSVNPGKSS